jgi:hypothetical protein
LGVHVIGVIGVVGVHVLGVIGVVGVHVLGVIGVIGVHVLGVIGVSAKTCPRTGCWQCRGYAYEIGAYEMHAREIYCEGAVRGQQQQPKARVGYVKQYCEGK